jgi:hypothetical protein
MVFTFGVTSHETFAGWKVFYKWFTLAWLARVKVNCYCTQVEEKGCLCLVFNMLNISHGWVGASSNSLNLLTKGVQLVKPSRWVAYCVH